MKQLLNIAPLMALIACVEPPTKYRPVIDSSKSSSVKFERSLAACRNIALQAEADYKAKQDNEMGQKIIAGIFLSAVAGAAIGDSSNYAAA